MYIVGKAFVQKSKDPISKKKNLRPYYAREPIVLFLLLLIENQSLEYTWIVEQRDLSHWERDKYVEKRVYIFVFFIRQ